MKKIIIGKFGSAYGILGWINIISYTERKKNIFQYNPWFIQINNLWKKYFIESYKKNISKIKVKLKNINNRTEAKKLTNCIISIKNTQLKKIPKYEYYWKDILYCQVFNIDKKYIGIVYDIIRSKINDILVIKNFQKKNKCILIPFIEKVFIKNTDIKRKIIYIN
ncbi:ribosome maturation factor RimM [Buchnera aphidicola]|uniref:ribosome maturation factor RimM n=1 Tax=Buchnera aphidicola TaxID=9 RepID=UPI0031B89669